MAIIRWTEESLKWLRDIHDFIASDNPNAARKVVSGIYEKSQILKDFPEIGYLHRAEPEGEIRILLYGHYRIAYLLKSTSSIDILGVFHGALNIDRYFP
jgi:plasmid stabilization system protein ParE